jgi:sensor c-di-GMP phosphodiesterase-like protein
VVAEGVETAAQRELLKALGTELAQGYFFDPALPPEAFAARWLTP